jgi:hypothetical protein
MDDTTAFDAAIDELNAHVTAMIRRFAVFCTGMRARSLALLLGKIILT